MLVLTRKATESVRIGGDVVVKVIRTGKGTVKLGIDAPAHVRVLRAELADAADDPTPARREAAAPAADDAAAALDPFRFDGDDADAEFALPVGVACGGYVALPAAAR